MTESVQNRGLPHGDEWMVCPCGNSPEMCGYAACDAAGALQESEGTPSPDWDGGHYRCLDCGRFFSRESLVVLGRIWEPGQEGYDATREHLASQYAAWQRAQGVSLGDAADHLLDKELTDAQRTWLAGWVERMSLVEDVEKMICGWLGISPDLLPRYEVEQNERSLPLVAAFVYERLRPRDRQVLEDLLDEAARGRPAVLARSKNCALTLRR